MTTGLEHLPPGTVAALGEEWVQHLALQDRDPRLVGLAMNRALKVPDDAGTVDRATVLQEHVWVFGQQSLAAMFELEYQRVVSQSCGHDADGDVDPVVRWVVQHRDREDLRSREWWALERLRLDYLRHWALGQHPSNL